MKCDELDDERCFYQRLPSFLGTQMHVPDSITIGPNRAAPPRLHQDQDRLPIRMEVPDSIRLGGGGKRMEFVFIEYFFSYLGHSHRMDLENGWNNDMNSAFSTQQRSFHPSDTEVPSDEEYSAMETPRNHQPIRMADS